ncbi:ChrR family anti-sigma-E factor [Gemmobacter fulvus]|uniref:ChrR family anti-sigma-E factor n=1 Tax=Gemmobacter fulvus TaxID=2840474 RepID=A0A975S0U9_9RHOB|nr:ChrR family anti-sigma-E factor [Gemmobacter fulvus]MBT9245769.1 ChrR family anti-sigma-E factor [Gemmobacter fulvus]MDQ1847016.1 ChrR family anti-sigma-E factor [Gemmobacter fulvus]QWK89390.1 ChrR family anti-sigma-E factor [Gemmobacter fulvus]
MTIRHHVSDALLMAYSAGQLPEAFNLVLATHLSLCDDCRARLGAYDALGGAMLDTCQAQLAGDSLEACMARIAGQPPASAPAARPPRGLFPQPLQDYVGGDLAAVKWRPLGMGVRQAILPTGRSATARLLFIPAGQAVPDHGHRGTELTLVLQGAFSDATDRFGPGDLEIANEELEHTPVAEPGQDCICLAATDAPLRFTGMIPRLLQPLFRI